MKKEFDYKKNTEFLNDPKNLEKLRVFNNKLLEIQKNLLEEIKEVNKTALKRLHDKNDWVEDFETKITVDLFFDESHNDYEKFLKENDDDNLIATFDMYMSPSKKNDGIRERDDYYLLDPAISHNEWQFYPKDPLAGEFHCYLYHHIYDHLYGDMKLNWETILKIGTIWTDIEIIYQRMYEL